MGKNKIAKSLISLISIVILHKILVKYTNRTDSKNFLNAEVSTYRDSALKKASTAHWNSEEQKEIKEKSIKRAEEDLESKYFDVKYSKEELEKFAEKTIGEIFEEED